MLSWFRKLVDSKEYNKKYIEFLETRCEELQEKLDSGIHYINEHPCVYTVNEYRYDGPEVNILGRYPLSNTTFVDIGEYLSRLLSEISDEKNTMFFVNFLHQAYKHQNCFSGIKNGFDSIPINIIEINVESVSGFEFSDSTRILFQFKKRKKIVQIVYHHNERVWNYMKFFRARYEKDLDKIVVAMNNLISRIY